MSEEYCLEEEYDPESRFADLSDVEPEFWRKNRWNRCPTANGNFYAMAAASAA